MRKRAKLVPKIFLRRIYRLTWIFYTSGKSEAICFHIDALASRVPQVAGSGGGKLRIPSGIEGWASFLPPATNRRSLYFLPL